MLIAGIFTAKNAADDQYDTQREQILEFIDEWKHKGTR
jgi:hypothetical protein